jgi:hypothetical protein
MVESLEGELSGGIDEYGDLDLQWRSEVSCGEDQRGALAEGWADAQPVLR